MSEDLQGESYRIVARWPNAASDPLVEYVQAKDVGIKRVLQLAELGTHTSIQLLTPYGLEVIRMWGQLDGMP